MIKPIKTVNIFMSSTFKDMHEERDYLLTAVFPRIDSMLRKQFLMRLNVVDLRGSSQDCEDDKIQQTVFKYCLDEVNNCRPLMLGILGNNYGWIPYSGNSDDGDGMYDTIQAISDKYGYSVEEIKGKSITHLEILHGLRVMDLEKCYFFFRQMKYRSDISENDAKKYCLTDQYLENKNKIGEVVNLIKNTYGIKTIASETEPGYHFQTYEVSLNDGKLSSLASFGNLVYRNISSSISGILYKANASHYKDWYVRIANYLDDKTFYSIRHPELEQLLKESLDPAVKGIVISGSVGVGKSVLLAQLCYELHKHEDILTIPFIGGLEPNIQNVETLMGYLIKIYGYEAKIPYFKSHEDYEMSVLHYLHTCAKYMKKSHIVLVADNLDKIQDLGITFGDSEAATMCLVCLDSPIFQNTSGVKYHHIKNPENIKEYVDAISIKFNKKLDSVIRDRIINIANETSGSLRQIELLITFLMTMTQKDYETFSGDKAHLQWMNRELDLFEACIAKGVEPSAAAAMKLTERAAELYGYGFVHTVLSLIENNPSGITTNDLKQRLMEQGLLENPQVKSRGLNIFKNKKERKEFTQKNDEIFRGLYSILRPLFIFDALNEHWIFNDNKYTSLLSIDVEIKAKAKKLTEEDFNRIHEKNKMAIKKFSDERDGKI